ncbi:MAG TPA: G8 domain-containing protein [Methylibium sp.]|nr:G8 domain-containing protein [Methylibium sp.]
MTDDLLKRVCGLAVVVTVTGLAGCGGGGSVEGDELDRAGPTEAATATSAWVRVAGEGQAFSVAGTSSVRYGAGLLWVRRSVSGSATCTAAFFGSDPAPGITNSCEVLTDTTVAVAPGEYRWSDASTWGGSVPGAGAEVVIPAGRTVVLDRATAALGALRIEGTLRFANDRDLAVTARSIRVSGALQIGSETQPYAHRAVITLNGVPGTVNDGVSRGLLVDGGALQIYATSPRPAWTKLNAHAGAGATALTLAQTTDWQAGQTVAVAPTDYYGRGTTQRLTLRSAAGDRVATNAGLATFRWGQLQYMTRAGMSLTPDPDYVPVTPTSPTVLDERAVVANLSRGVVIQGPDDSHWNDRGFGAHVMIMGLQSRVVVDGVEFRRVGQAGALGRYPFHWHMLSYNPGTGALLGDATGHVLRNSAIWDSANRCVVVHGTNGVRVVNNICQDIRGHAFFLEDGSERRNVFVGNVALLMRAPAANVRLQVHEADGFQFGSSGFWLTNPDNIVRNNVAGDASGNGFWMSYRHVPLGLSALVPVMPDRLRHGAFEHNTAHSNRGPGLLLDWVPVDAAGNVTPNRYIPTADGSDNTALANQVRFELRRITSYKNLDGAYRNRSQGPSYLEWMTADNVGTHFAGAGDFGLVARGLMVGYSLNHRTAYPTASGEMPTAFASYHSTFDLRSNTVVNFPYVDSHSSGTFKTNDYYLVPVDKGLVRNASNRLVGSHPGYRMPSPNVDASSTSAVPLAGALWDAHGYWGPAGNFWVYDLPFYTAGGPCTAVVPAGSNGMSCAGQYFGVYHLQTDFDNSRYAFSSPIEAIRQDANGTEIGRWSLLGGGASNIDHFQHFAARNGGRYVLRFPGRPLPRRLALSVSNAYRASDSMLLAVSFDGTVTAGGHLVSGFAYSRESASAPQYMRRFQQVSSLAAVMAGSGDRIWQDRTNNLVWVRIQGGLPYPNLENLRVNSDEALYRPLSVVLTAQ